MCGCFVFKWQHCFFLIKNVLIFNFKIDCHKWVVFLYVWIFLRLFTIFIDMTVLPTFNRIHKYIIKHFNTFWICELKGGSYYLCSKFKKNIFFFVINTVTQPVFNIVLIINLLHNINFSTWQHCLPLIMLSTDNLN